MNILPPDKKAHYEEVLSQVDMSERGTTEEIAALHDSVDGWMKPYRERVMDELKEKRANDGR